jgi:hypothetical protein
MTRTTPRHRPAILGAKRLPARKRAPGPGLADSCGCVTGARFLAVALVLSTAWYGWHWAAAGLSIWGALLRILVWSFLGATLGKIVGVVSFQLRSRRRARMAGRPPGVLKARGREHL